MFYCTACGTQNPEDRQTCLACNTPRARDVRPQAVRFDPGEETVVGERAPVGLAYQNVPAYQPPQASVCPRCHRAGHFLPQERVSTAGILVFGLLLLVCFPLCWIGLFIKDKYLVCSSCGMQLRAG